MRDRRRHALLLLFAGLGWLAAVCSGLAALQSYESTPAIPVASEVSFPAEWPSASGLARRPGLPTIVMAVHPRCPCSRASLGELAELMSRCDGLASADVVFLQPEGLDRDWVETDLWRTAASIPATTVRSDPAGRECLLFGARASGQTLLYDPEGRLLFAGGITSSRGHAGRNDGTDAIESFLREGHSRVTRTPVFGCALGTIGEGGTSG